MKNALTALALILMNTFYINNTWADEQRLMLIDMGPKSATVVDMNTMKQSIPGQISIWTYTILSTPVVDGNDYYLSKYSKHDIQCTADKIRTTDIHTYDLQNKETGTPYVDNHKEFSSIVPGTVATELERIVCIGVKPTDTAITVGMDTFKRNYYTALNEGKLQ